MLVCLARPAFVLGMLCAFMQYQNPRFNKSPNSRSNQWPISSPSVQNNKWHLKDSRRHDSKCWYRFRASSLYPYKSCWGAKVKEPKVVKDTKSKIGVEGPEAEASYWDSCRSTNKVYHGASAIFESCILEIVWHLRPIANLSTAERITEDQILIV